MTDPTPDQMSDEITPDDMRVLLVAMGFEDMGNDVFYLGEDDGDAIEISVSEFIACVLADEAPWFVLACQRFIESEKVRAVCQVNYFNQEQSPGGEQTPAIFIYNKNGKLIHLLTDPDPAVRWVKAAIAVAKELDAQRGKEGGK